MADWVILLFGLAILGLVIADRHDIATAWQKPARWWSPDPSEYMDSRRASQPLNVVLGVLLGSVATIYGAVSLVA